MGFYVRSTLRTVGRRRVNQVTLGAGGVRSGPSDLVDQLNRASVGRLLWPWLALVPVIGAALVLPTAVALIGLVALVLLVFWELARRTVAVRYEISGPAAEWYERFTSGFVSLTSLGGAWRIMQPGFLRGNNQCKVNSGPGHIDSRSIATFSLVPPRTLATNIRVPNVAAGRERLLFLPDRMLVQSGRRWGEVSYCDLRVSVEPTHFIESGPIPRDARQVDITWQYVTADGRPDRQVRDNQQLPVMLYGRIELTTAAGLHWTIDCSRADIARWLAASIARPAVHLRPSAQAEIGVHITPPAPAAAPRTSFAVPGCRGPLFAYADMLAEYPTLRRHDGPYAVVDVETTGFSAANGDRIIEIAIARVDREGRIEDEYATLLNPDGRDTGAVAVHGITAAQVRDAPRFGEVLGDVIARLDGCVLVAHNAAFEERFLAAELARCGVNLGTVPALCTLWLGRQTFRTPNHKLLTLAQHARVPLPDAHAALGDVRAIAALLPRMLDRFPHALGYSCAPVDAQSVPLKNGSARPRTRAASLRRGTAGWMSSILARLPLSAADAGDADAERYLEALSSALSDGRIAGDEARALPALAGAAGFGSAQVAQLNQRFLESVREAAFADDMLTLQELKELKTVAKALGVPGYFDDLSTHDSFALDESRRLRCGNCRSFGHYRSTCPRLTAAAQLG